MSTTEIEELVSTTGQSLKVLFLEDDGMKEVVFTFIDAIIIGVILLVQQPLAHGVIIEILEVDLIEEQRWPCGGVVRIILRG